MFDHDDSVKAAAERCAELEAWLRLENDPQVREQLWQELNKAREQLREAIAREREARERAGGVFPEGNVTDFLKKLDEAAAARKAADAAAGNGARAAGDVEPARDGPAAEREPERVRELVRELEVPAEIRALPEWPQAYREAIEAYNGFSAAALGREIGGDLAAARHDEVRELEAGAEIEGRIAAVIERDSQAYYVVEAEDGRRALVPVNGELDLEPGDDITASRDRDGSYDVEADHGYGR